MNYLFLNYYDVELRNPFLVVVGHDQTRRVSSADKKLFVHSQHASMINGLQFHYPIFGPVVRCKFVLCTFVESFLLVFN